MSKICKDCASNDDDNDNNLSNAIGYLRLLNIKDNKTEVDNVCANCGKEGSSDVNNICNKCRKVKYCNAACKKKHRHKHKKDCEEHVRLAAERAAELHDIELFKQPPPFNEDCPICFLRIPALQTGYKYYTCCGKVICSRCVHAPVYDNQGNKVAEDKCAFCRASNPKSKEEMIKRDRKRMEKDDAQTIHNMGIDYRDGTDGLPQDYTKALELWHRAAALGFAISYSCIGYAYASGRGVEVDQKKAIHYFELAAMGGDETARHNLGFLEHKSGNTDKALKHHMIAIRDGYAKSLEKIKQLYSNGHATKEDYMTALRSYQAYLSEIKSKQRDEAAAADEDYRYY